MPDNSQPRYDADDTWAKAVSLFTGFPMPSRAALFEKLSSSDGIPLFRMGIDKHACSNLAIS